MSALDALGLTFVDWRGQVELADGVVVTVRAPSALDWTRARARIVEVFDPLDKLRSASARYGMTEDDRGVMADPSTWEGIADYVLMVEVAMLVVSAVNRTDIEGRVYSATPSIDILASLLRRGDNLDRFAAKMREAERELLVPKKEPAPSPDGSGAAAAITVTDAEPLATPVPGAA